MKKYSVVRALLAVPCALAAASAGQVAGTVTDRASKPVAGIVIVATVRPAGGAPGNLSVKTDSKGAFTLNVPAGRFRLCVPGADNYADPCKWWATPPAGTATAAGTTTVAPIALDASGPLQVRVSDESGLLQNEGKIAGANILVGAWTAKGMFVALPVASKDSGGRTHAAPVPLNTPIHVTVSSSAFSFNDDKGKPLPQNGSAADVQVTSAAGQSVTVHVAAVAKGKN